MNLHKALRESFLPLIMLILGLFLTLLYVQFKAAMDSEQAIVIEVTAQPGDEAEDSGADDTTDSADSDTVSTRSNQNPLLTEIQSLTRKKRWRDAERKYLELLRTEDTSENLTGLGVIYWKMEKKEEAMARLNEAIHSPPVFPNAYFYRGLIHSNRKKYDLAIQDYKKTISLMPNHVNAHYNMGLAYIKRKEPAKAAEAFQSAATLSGGTRKARALYHLGLALRRVGPENNARAADAYRKAIRLKPDYLNPRFGLIAIGIDDPSQRESALQEAEMALRLKPNSGQAHLMKGRVLAAMGRQQQAIDAFLDAMRFHPQSADIRQELGNSYLQMKKWEDAQTQFQWLQGRYPKNPQYAYGLGLASLGLKNPNKALQYFQQALALSREDFPQARQRRVETLMSLNRLDEAEKTLRTDLAKENPAPDGYFLLGRLYLRRNKPQDAEKAFQQAVRLDARNAGAWATLGEVYASLNRHEDALAAYQEATRLNPEDPNSRLGEGQTLFHLKKHVEAEHIFKKLLDTNPAYAPAWEGLGKAFLAQGKAGKAADALQHALELEPDNLDILRKLAQAKAMDGDIQDGVELLKRAVDAQPGDAELRLEYSKLLRTQGNTTEADAELRKARLLDPENKLIQKEIKSLERH
ncbi:MAG: tetratricopeptide repeat protein [Deltaproteobacteria bacterium]|nr:tetratricopeptide repeat protein [Deltaproteobacteria bacterium]